MGEFCLSIGIYHHKIRPKTPRHNEKVERIHRKDNERYCSLQDLRYQGCPYLKMLNNIPMEVLKFFNTNWEEKQLLKR